jgi:hypothetical protein
MELVQERMAFRGWTMELKKEDISEEEALAKDLGVKKWVDFWWVNNVVEKYCVNIYGI